MPIVTLKCKHCGGDVELDDTREFGFCVYCGTKIMIQQEINNIHITMGIGEQVANLKVLMTGHYQAGRYGESYELAGKIINLNVADLDVWYIATISLLKSCTYDSLPSNRMELERLL